MKTRDLRPSRLLYLAMALLLASSTVLAACGSQPAPAPAAAPAAQATEVPNVAPTEPPAAPEPTKAPAAPTQAPAPVATAAPAAAAAAAPVACSGELPLVGKGPNGEEPVGLASLKLTPEDEAKLKAGNFTAAISMHLFGADWPQLQIKGISDTLAKYGVKVIATTDGELKAEKQVADMENLIQLKPSVILHIPVDNDALAAVDKKVQEAGIKLVLIDSKPTGLEPGKDYVGLGAADNYANGAAAADIIAEQIGGKGKVALMRWGFHVFQTEQRRQGALDTFKTKYPGIEVVFDQDVNSVEETTSACENLLTKYPDLKGIWTAWDGMGTACTQAANGMNRKDVAISSIDLSKDSGLWIAKDSPFKGTGAQHPYDQGVAEAMLALYSLAGKEAPPYVVIPGRKVVRDNIVCAMDTVFHAPPSQELVDAAGPQK